ncbi:MAG: 2,3-bisphosphoglycerate-independent phosphoglycerate mutase, partial [Candidatus Gottesmanbacteria bacterium]|nr:2,3-bisphosphoglycerate-independent phosphoglycerate mutase [Candidatus Gottesmanbacteria bacterium]
MIKPIALIVLDGWGIAPPGPGNAISLARLTNIPKYWNNYPHTELSASGISVGLPEG